MWLRMPLQQTNLHSSPRNALTGLASLGLTENLLSGLLARERVWGRNPNPNLPKRGGIQTFPKFFLSLFKIDLLI
jgi:hypothetical protein